MSLERSVTRTAVVGSEVAHWVVRCSPLPKPCAQFCRTRLSRRLNKARRQEKELTESRDQPILYVEHRLRQLFPTGVTAAIHAAKRAARSIGRVGGIAFGRPNPAGADSALRSTARWRRHASPRPLSYLLLETPDRFRARYAYSAPRAGIRGWKSCAQEDEVSSLA